MVFIQEGAAVCCVVNGVSGEVRSGIGEPYLSTWLHYGCGGILFEKKIWRSMRAEGNAPGTDSLDFFYGEIIDCAV